MDRNAVAVMIKNKKVNKLVKTYVLDTNILLDDPNSIINFDNCNIIIPYIVIEELDKHKDRSDNVGANARSVTRKITSFIDNGKNESLSNGVKLENNATLYALTIHDIKHILEQEKTLDKLEINDMIDFGDRKKGDNIILEFMMILAKTNKFSNAVLVTRDMLLRCKSNVFSIKAEDYKKDAAIKKNEELYTGRVSIPIKEKHFELLVNKVNLDYTKLEKTGPVQIADVETFFESLGKDYLDRFNIFPNSYISFCLEGNEEEKITLRYDAHFGSFMKLRVPHIRNYKPKTLEHQIALDMLTNPKISLCTLVGSAGTGKSLATLAAALQQTDIESMFTKTTNTNSKPVSRDAQFDYILVTKPTQAVGEDIGFLPGSKKEKILPWLGPITDNLKILLSKNGRKEIAVEQIIDNYFESGIIELEAITYMRGRSISNAFMIGEEMQNCSIHELKTILTRVGENTKIVLTGDLHQIDALHVNYYTSGLTNVIEKFKTSELSAHLLMEKGIRSNLASAAAELL